MSFVLYFVGRPPVYNDMGRYMKGGQFKLPKVIPQLYIHVTMCRYGFLFSNQTDTQFIQIYSVTKLYMFQATFCTPSGVSYCTFGTLTLLGSGHYYYYYWYSAPWAGLGRDQSSFRRLVWLWYAASWASS